MAGTLRLQAQALACAMDVECEAAELRTGANRFHWRMVWSLVIPESTLPTSVRTPAKLNGGYKLLAWAPEAKSSLRFPNIAIGELVRTAGIEAAQAVRPYGF